MRQAKISLDICLVWSVFACAQWVAKDPSFLHADRENAQADWSLCWVGFVMRLLKSKKKQTRIMALANELTHANELL